MRVQIDIYIYNIYIYTYVDKVNPIQIHHCGRFADFSGIV